MERLERAKKEHEELSEKIVKLKIYLASHKDELDKEDYALLLAQDYVMDLYLDILLKRIEKHSQSAFSPDGEIYPSSLKNG